MKQNTLKLLVSVICTVGVNKGMFNNYATYKTTVFCMWTTMHATCTTHVLY